MKITVMNLERTLADWFREDGWVTDDSGDMIAIECGPIDGITNRVVVNLTDIAKRIVEDFGDD